VLPNQITANQQTLVTGELEAGVDLACLFQDNFSFFSINIKETLELELIKAVSTLNVKKSLFK